MVRCQCLKADGQQCTRDVSNKPSQNILYCWQHQKCQKPYTLPITIHENKTEIKSNKITNKQLIDAINASYELAKKLNPILKDNETKIPKIRSDEIDIDSLAQYLASAGMQSNELKLALSDTKNPNFDKLDQLIDQFIDDDQPNLLGGAAHLGFLHNPNALGDELRKRINNSNLIYVALEDTLDFSMNDDFKNIDLETFSMYLAGVGYDANFIKKLTRDWKYSSDTYDQQFRQLLDNFGDQIESHPADENDPEVISFYYGLEFGITHIPLIHK